MYPHGANPILEWDTRPLHPNVQLAIVHGSGQAEVMAAYGLPARVEVVGWSYSELAPRRYPNSVRRILFAPSHPLLNGYDPTDHELEDRVLRALCESGAEVIERRWKPGGSLAHDDIDAADLVVAEGTVAYLAAARGVPLIMYGQDTCPDIGREAPVLPKQWEEYRHLYRYPFDFADAPLPDLIAAATRPNDLIDTWTDRLVGGPFDARRVAELVECA